ncbi:MAG: NAD-dependent epimerase/dehydratase family protein [Niabella sp.]
MRNDKILVIGASGQIGAELTLALRELYGNGNVIASDLNEQGGRLSATGPYLSLDVMERAKLHSVVVEQRVTQVYLLAAMLSASGEQRPEMAWQINMQGLLNVLEIAKIEKLHKIFWPSSIAVFGPTSPKQNCPQQTIIEPATVYGISKFAGECWCRYYHRKYGLDIRSLRYPGLISYKAAPGGGTTDYAIDIFYHAMKEQKYTCFLSPGTKLPMMYMPDAIRAAIELMETPQEMISVRSSYNIGALSFSPAALAASIQKHIPGFAITYQPDYRQAIAADWPESIDDSVARRDWGWKPRYDLDRMTEDMMANILADNYV